jgi:hypothetical protein
VYLALICAGGIATARDRHWITSVCYSPTQEKPVLHYNIGEVVERSELSNTTRGTVVYVTASGEAVTVQWYDWLGLEGRESTHRSDELVRVSY